MDPAARLRELVTELLTAKGDTAPFGDDDSLLLSGRLASADVLELVVALEESFGVNFADRPFDRMHFDSVSAMRRLVEDAIAA